MTEVFLVRTIPHTGTYFVNELLRSHSQVSVVSLDSATSQKLHVFVREVVKNRMEFAYFDRLIICYRQIGKQIAEKYHDLDLVKEVSERSPFSYLGLFAHFAPKRYQGKYWLGDLLEAGYAHKIVIPLRDPILAAISVFTQSGGNVQGMEQALRSAYKSFEYLGSYPKDLQPTTFFVPVDLWGRLPKDKRVEKAKDLFEDFFGLTLDQGSIEKIREWPMCHPTEESMYAPFKYGEELGDLLEAKRLVSSGLDCRGIHKRLDEEIERYKKLPGLQELFKKYEYENLCWGGN